MWIIKRLKSMGANPKQRSVLETAVPVWKTVLTISDILSIKTALKSFSHIALGKEYKGYNEAISALGLEKLEVRRIMLCRTFEIKTAQNKKLKKCSY